MYFKNIHLISLFTNKLILIKLIKNYNFNCIFIDNNIFINNNHKINNSDITYILCIIIIDLLCNTLWIVCISLIILTKIRCSVKIRRSDEIKKNKQIIRHRRIVALS